MKTSLPNFRVALLCSAVLFATPSLAQSEPSPAPLPEAEAGADGEAIIVTGQRRAQYEATAEKRDAFIVMDAISSDDIGKLPDHNTAAALRRIPGLSVQEDQGEPRFPVLRGLQSTYNRTTVDGALVSGVDSTGRTVPLDIIPSVMAARIEVIKTVTPENDANAIGGIINIATRSAFDAKRAFFNGVASYGVYEQNGDVRNSKPSYRVAFAAGTTFGANDEWGVVIGASQEQLDYDIPQIEVASPSVREYTAAGAPVNSGAANGNGIQVPTQHRLFWYNNTKQRTGGNVKLEWRPSDRFRWELSGVVARTEDDEERIEYRIEQIGNVANQTPTSGDFARGRIIVQLNQPITKRLVALGRTAFDWDAGEKLKVDGDAVFSLGRLRVPNESIEFRTRDADGARYAFHYDTSDFYPVFTPTNAAAAVDPTNFYLQQQRSDLQKSLEKSGQFRLNLTWGDDRDDGGVKLKTGGVIRLTDRENSNPRTDYRAASGFTYTLDEVVASGPTKPIRGQFTIPIRVDANAFPAFYEANKGSFTTTVDKVSFTGSTATGKTIMAGAADRLVRVTLELGGNDAAIVLDDVDIEATARAIFAAACRNSGQLCVAAKRVFVMETIYDRFAAALAAEASNARLGDGLDPATTMGPIQNRKQYDRLVGIAAELRASGARLIHDGGPVAGPGLFFAPMIVDNPPDASPLVEEEQFGPIIPLLSFAKVDDAIARANASPYGLAASVWTSDIERAEAIAARLEVGTVWINEIFHFSPFAPFGGHKHSGIGAESGIDGLKPFLQPKTISLNRAPLPG